LNEKKRKRGRQTDLETERGEKGIQTGREKDRQTETVKDIQR